MQERLRRAGRNAQDLQVHMVFRSPRRFSAPLARGNAGRLVVLLMAGCQDEGTPDGSNQAAVDGGKTSDATEQHAVMVRPPTRTIRHRIRGRKLSDCSRG
jgi:hypothetical protein